MIDNLGRRYTFRLNLGNESFSDGGSSVLFRSIESDRVTWVGTEKKGDITNGNSKVKIV